MQRRPLLLVLRLHLNLLVEPVIFWVVADQYLLPVLLPNTKIEMWVIRRVTRLGIYLVLRCSVEVVCIDIVSVQSLELHLGVLSLLLGQWSFIHVVLPA